MDDDDMYDEPGGTTQKLPSGRYAVVVPHAPPPKFATELPISNFASMIRNSFSSFILGINLRRERIIVGIDSEFCVYTWDTA